MSLFASRSTLATALSLALCTAPIAVYAQATPTFNLPAQSLADSLREVGSKAGVNVAFEPSAVKGKKAPALKGSYTVQEALQRLIEGAGLTLRATEGGTFLIEPARPKRSTDEVTVATGQEPEPIPSDSPKEGTEETAEGPTAEPAIPIDRRSVATTMDTMVVTGTRIRGSESTAPVHTVTQKDIKQSGYTQIGDVLRSLPENFSGGQNPGIIGASATNVANDNYTNASTINLRGLGTDATLVLVNGRRLSADAFFQGSDISGVPLLAVQRIEVVPDGASAIYGSDAVAGVANIILRKDYNGIDVNAYSGVATQGGGQLSGYSALGGYSDENWYGLVNFEYSKQDAIKASERDFTVSVPSFGTLLRGQERKSLFVTAGRNLTDRTVISFDALLSEREDHDTSFYSDAYTSSMKTPGYSVSTVLDTDMGGDWKLRLVGAASGSHSDNRVVTSGVEQTYKPVYENAIRYVEITADGTLLKLPAGDLKIAIGGGHRNERLQISKPGAAGYFEPTRNVDYLYGEIFTPLVTPSASRWGLHELELSLSGRAERYSDFGRSVNPKIGFRYLPFKDLTIRGTWGKSFKAPSFYQKYSMADVYLFPAEILGYGEGVAGDTALWANGGNSELGPERSTSWTFGADYAPSSMDSLKLSATYFDIDYTDRVVQPVANVAQGFSNPIYAPFVSYSPSNDAQADLIAGADRFYNYSGYDYDPSRVVGILYNYYQNATSQRVSGMDFSYRQKFDLGQGELEAFGNATWLRMKQQTIESVPSMVLSGTIFNVPTLKARAGVSWSRGGFAATGIVNYVSDGTDTGVTPNRAISSWTTADTTISYRFSEGTGFLSQSNIGLSISNLLDRDPPRVVSPSILVPGLYFDSTNSSVIGRFVSLSLSKSW